jgi:plasmid stabilization system protein ParE
LISIRRVNLADFAEANLNEAYLWWAKHRSAEQAGRWYRAIITRINALSKTARRYSLALENDRFSFEVRQMLFGLGRRPTHRVLFTIRDNDVYVIAIRHVSQRLLRPGDLVE